MSAENDAGFVTRPLKKLAKGVYNSLHLVTDFILAPLGKSTVRGAA